MNFTWHRDHITPGKRFRLIGVPEEMMIVCAGDAQSVEFQHEWYAVNLTHGSFLPLYTYSRQWMAEKLTEMGATPV